MIEIFNHREIAEIRQAGQVLIKIHHLVYSAIEDILNKPTNTKRIFELSHIDKLAGEIIRSQGAQPILYNYEYPTNPPRIYKANTCISIGNALVHGVPKGIMKFRTWPLNGKGATLFTIDIAIKYRSWCADAARSYTNITTVGNDEATRESIADEAITKVPEAEMVAHLNQCLGGITDFLHEDVRLSDIGNYIEEFATRRGYIVPIEYGGHGIGRQLHMSPHVPCLWKKEWPDTRLKAGMVICIEPMFIRTVLKPEDHKLTVDPKDGWTVRSNDENAICGHQEAMFLIESRSCEILAM